MPLEYLAVLLSALAFAISVFSFFFFKSYLKRRTGQERILSEFREEVEKILRWIDGTTDRSISLVEDKEKNLKSVLEEIDKRLMVYIRELDKRRESEAAHTTLVAKAPPYMELGKNRGRLYRQSSVPAPVATETTEPVNVPQAAPAAEASGPSGMGEKIRELALAGLSPQLIASHLGLSIAEVEFVAALMERRDAQT